MKIVQNKTPQLMVGIILMRCGWFAAIPFISIYLYNNISHNPLLISFIAGLSYLASSIGGFLGGAIVDRYSPKKIMLISILMASIGFFTLYFMRFTIIIMSMNFLIGLSSGIFEVSTKTYISLNYNEPIRSHIYNLRYTAINIGAALGPIVGVWLLNHLLEIVYFFSGFVYLLVFIVYAILLKDTSNLYQKNDHKFSYFILFKILHADRNLFLILLISIIVFISYSQVQTTLSQALAASNIKNYLSIFSSILIVNGAIIIICQIPLGLIIHKFNEKLLSYFSVVLFVSSFCIYAFASNYISFIIATILLSIGEIITSIVTK